MSGETGPHGLMMSGYEGGYQSVPGYHAAGYEDRGHGVQWPGYHHHHGAAHSQGSPTQRYPYYDSRQVMYSTV